MAQFITRDMDIAHALMILGISDVITWKHALEKVRDLHPVGDPDLYDLALEKLKKFEDEFINAERPRRGFQARVASYAPAQERFTIAMLTYLRSCQR